MLRGALAFAAALLTSGISAQTADNFFAGRTITFVVGTDAGGGYDTYARLLGRYLGKYIPGAPSVVVQNMLGGSGRRAANFLYTAASQDGLWLGTLEQNVPFTQAMERDNAFFDVMKFNYIGNMSSNVSTIVSWHTTGVKTIEDARNKEIVIGATGSTGTNTIFPRLLNEIAGTKLRVVSGYKGGADLDLAMERGETGGRGSFAWTSIKSTKPEWLRDGKISILVQIGLRRAPDLPNVPLLLGLARTDEERQIVRLISSGTDLGRIVLSTPNVPPSRAALLREAFNAAMKDSGLLAEAERMTLDINPATGQEVQDIVTSIMSTPAEVIEKTRKYLN